MMNRFLLATSYIAALAAFAISIVSEWSTSHGWIVFVLAGGGAVLLGWQTYRQGWGSSRNYQRFPKKDTFETKEKIKEYMLQLLESGGSTAIFTRRMSWVNAKIEAILLEKAKNNALIICMHEKTDLSEKLSGMGARVYYYGSFTNEEVLSARFTIINYGRMQPELAISHEVDDVHVIERFSKASDHQLNLAKEMFEMIVQAYRIFSDDPRQGILPVGSLEGR